MREGREAIGLLVLTGPLLVSCAGECDGGGRGGELRVGGGDGGGDGGGGCVRC